MALGPCRECGKQVSDDAKSCPHCGVARPIKKTSVMTMVVGAFFVVFVAMSVTQYVRIKTAPPPPPPTPEQIKAEQAASAAKAQKEMTLLVVVAAMTAVKRTLRDPDSVQWESVLANDDATLICIEYRARNGFGGMDSGHIVIDKTSSSRTVSAWNRQCANKPLHDFTKATASKP